MARYIKIGEKVKLNLKGSNGENYGNLDDTIGTVKSQYQEITIVDSDTGGRLMLDDTQWIPLNVDDTIIQWLEGK